jgi:hypothetical protein
MIPIVEILGAPDQTSAGLELGLDRRGELPDGRMALRLQQLRHLHSPGPGHPAQVVAHHVDDHQVAGPLLL